MDRPVTPCLFVLAMLRACSVAHAAILGDPTRPAAAFMSGGAESAPAAPVESPLVLEGIGRSAAQAYALINGQRVAIGGSVRGYRLASVATDSVVLLDAAGQRHTLRLIPALKKREGAAPAGPLHGEKTP